MELLVVRIPACQRCPHGTFFENDFAAIRDTRPKEIVTVLSEAFFYQPKKDSSTVMKH